MKITHIIPASVILLILTSCITMFYSCSEIVVPGTVASNDSNVFFMDPLFVSTGLTPPVLSDSVYYDADSTQWVKFKVQYDSLVTDCPDTALASAGYYFIRKSDGVILYSYTLKGLNINSALHNNLLTLSTNIPYDMRFVFFVKFSNPNPISYFIRARNIRLIRSYP